MKNSVMLVKVELCYYPMHIYYRMILTYIYITTHLPDVCCSIAWYLEVVAVRALSYNHPHPHA